MTMTVSPMEFVFDSRVGFSGTSDRMDLFLVGPDPRWQVSRHLHHHHHHHVAVEVEVGHCWPLE